MTLLQHSTLRRLLFDSQERGIVFFLCHFLGCKKTIHFGATSFEWFEDDSQQFRDSRMGAPAQSGEMVPNLRELAPSVDPNTVSTISISELDKQSRDEFGELDEEKVPSRANVPGLPTPAFCSISQELDASTSSFEG
ncbi:hypothetical protein SCHPADRAFT_984333 [Schizopora paradoxa]|uniref:Uncharacterized protein n=1 Tax=Schizopora paradoxa TaxID=27342 RepID=A0A0H2RCR6_9AGAM|nr:hypothetical protein SCHPADRAFT_984333 [Schizopora paradoxa]